MGCVAVLSLMRTMELEFLQPHPRPILQQNELLIPPIIELIQSLHGKLQSLIELFDENRMDGVEAIKILETRLRDVAFRVEDEIELQVVHLYQEEERDTRGPGGCSMLCQIFHRPNGNPRECNDVVERTCPSLTLGYILQQAIQDIDAIKEELVKVKEEYELSKYLQGRNAALDVLPKRDDEVIMMADSSHHASHSKEIMVGKQDEFEIIKEKLIQHQSKQLEVVSIKGMGGIGKTTLAKKIYEDPSIISYFDKQAWTVASQHHSKRQMLLDLLGSIDDADKRSDGDLALLLRQSFKKCQRYLVVMDDVWSEEAWDVVKTCFPDDGNGSRVLLTTRLAEVANYTCSKDYFSHQMQLLEQTESWKLFGEKACKSRGTEFEMIGRPVVEKCKGLPLAIIVVAGLFSKLGTLDEWKNTANALSSSSSTTLDDEECLRIFSLSYNHLLHNLKACFLYLGVFPEDHEIDANNLARLWLAEGLVKAFDNENFDAVANRYMQELMDRNLIILSELCSRGRKIKRFRMHDLLHAFCVREAQNENLLHVAMSENRSGFPQKGFRWVSIQTVNFDMSTIRSQSKNCRSFFYFLWEESSLKFKDFNLLRVLYSNRFHGKFKKVLDIVHLRFLRWVKYIKLSRVQGFLKSRCRKDIELIWSWNLQTLDCCEIGSYRSDDERNYSEFPQLHYINCVDYIHGNLPSFVHKLYRIRVDDCSQEYIKNIPFLKKACIVSKGGDDYNDCITNLASSEQLEGLCFDGNGWYIHTPITNHIANLKNLRKLSFSCMGFCSGQINILSKLPRLEVLKLKWMLFPGPGREWEIQEEVIFCSLIFLQFFHSFLEHWKASSPNFPKLEHLSIIYCKELREIPFDFAEISTLKSIKLSECLPSLVESAKKIQDEQRDYGNYNMIVTEEYTLND